MKMKMPFDGFYLKLLDEQNGTHEYEEYLRNCKENPLTEEEQREWTESARAAIAELEQLNAEPEPTRQAAEPEVEAEGTSSPQTPEPAELQEGCCAVQEAEEVLEVEVVPAEAIVPLGQTGEDAPAACWSTVNRGCWCGLRGAVRPCPGTKSSGLPRAGAG